MTKPDSKSGIVKAWKVDINDAIIAAHVKEWGYPPAGVRTWYVLGPFNPVWHWWMVAVISLKDIEGVPPAKKQYPEAEYEFGIYSLSGEVNIDACDKGDLANRGFGILWPPDVIFHFHGLTDDQASQVCDHAVRAIVSGISPDSDNRSWWEGSLAATVTHFTLGVHE